MTTKYAGHAKGMRLLGLIRLSLGLMVAALPWAEGAGRKLWAAGPEVPPLTEVMSLLRSNAAGVSERDLNRAAVLGMLQQLENRAWLLEPTQAGDMDTNTTTLGATAVFDEDCGYVRVSRVEAGLAEQVSRALLQLTTTNKLKGLAIDLRFATGNDYATAGAVADLFIAAEQKLFDWSGGTVRSHAKTNAFRAPVAVLINRFTAGAAEVLGAVLRDTDVALLIGTNTAGKAGTTKDFRLSNGKTLRIATAPVRLGSGDEVGSLKPDIQVDVSPEDERAWFVDAYRVLPRPGFESNAVAVLSVTNRGPRRRLNEAELVRMSREGIDPEEEGARTNRTVVNRPVIADMALARAVDLLKALAVVRKAKTD